MATAKKELSNREWRPLGIADAGSQVTHVRGAAGYPVLLRKLAADPTHPFTDGAFEFKTFQFNGPANTIYRVNKSRNLVVDILGNGAIQQFGTIEQGGFHLEDPADRVPLLHYVYFYTDEDDDSNPRYNLRIFLHRVDGEEIVDAETEDKADIEITFDNDTSDATPAITLSGGTGTGKELYGQTGYEFAWTMTQAQFATIIDASKEKSFTLDASAAVPKIKTYSAFEETHPDLESAGYVLRHYDSVFVSKPSEGDVYGRATNPEGGAVFVED